MHWFVFINFDRMKKYWFPILLICSILLVFISAGNAPAKETNNAASQLGKANHHSDFNFTYPHTELKIQSRQSLTATNRNHRFQSFSGYITPEAYLRGDYSDCSLQNKDYEAGIYFKKYLSHIYPSHNFW